MAGHSQMIDLLENPAWVDNRLVTNSEIEHLPQSLFDEIKNGLSKFNSSNPLVSVTIPAHNEEYGILRTLESLSRNQTSYEVEIIVINNNSTDRTQEILDKLNVKSFFQSVPGWGPARQLGLEKASGKYVLMADSDCFYPPEWIQEMTTSLSKENVTCVYGGYSYLGTREEARWKFLIYELLRNLILEIRQMKHPYLNARGLNMGIVRALALKKGFINRKMKGEDGRMCFDLMQYGKIVRVSSKKNLVWTLRRTSRDGGIMNTFIKNVLIEFSKFKTYFRKPRIHDTHTSANVTPSEFNYSRQSEESQLEKKTGVGENIDRR